MESGTNYCECDGGGKRAKGVTREQILGVGAKEERHLSLLAHTIKQLQMRETTTAKTELCWQRAVMGFNV